MKLDGTNHALKENNKRLMVINHQFKVKYKSQRASLAAYKETHLLQQEGRKRWSSGPGLNYSGSFAPEKGNVQSQQVCYAKISTITGK